MIKHITIEIFKKALSTLDAKLTKHIEIKAIGGFALLYHGIRLTGVTADIDTVTGDYDADVLSAIIEVAHELDIAEDWLNNYNVMAFGDDSAEDASNVESIINAVWEKSGFVYEHISLWVADLETLLTAKTIASEDDNLTARNQDYPDMVEILRKLGCKSFAEVMVATDGMGIDLETEYPRNWERLQETFS